MKWTAIVPMAMVGGSLFANAGSSSGGVTRGDGLTGLISAINEGWHRQVDGPAEITLPEGVKAEMVLFCHTRWEPKWALAQMEGMERILDAMKLPEPERLKVMNRIDDYSQMWFMRLADCPAAGARLKAVLVPSSRTNTYHREVAFLGKANGYAWYGYMAIWEWIALQKKFQIQGGDDPIAGATRGLEVRDTGNCTANSCEPLIVQYGAAAVPYVRPVLATAQNSRAFSALGQIQGQAAYELLLECYQSTNQTLAAKARGALMSNPRPEAEALYFRWLDEDAGRTPVLYLLGTCAKVNKSRLAPLLPRILAAPHSVYELRLAFELSRSLAGKEFPPELLEAERVIMRNGHKNTPGFNQQKVDEAVAELVRSADTGAAACIGVSLALATTKGGLPVANEAGVAILKGLPNQRGRLMAKALYHSCDDHYDKQRLKEVIGD